MFLSPSCNLNHQKDAINFDNLDKLGIVDTWHLLGKQIKQPSDFVIYFSSTKRKVVVNI